MGSFSQTFLLVSSLLACSDPPSWTGTVEVVDGSEVISNPSVPLLPEPAGPVSELWSLQGADWRNPSRVHVQGGLVTVVDPPAGQIHLIHATGDAGRSLGRPGGGPGEFLRLLDALPDGDRLVVLDGGKSTIDYLDLEGGYLSSVHVMGQPWGGFLMDSGDLLVKGEFLSDPAAESFGDWVTLREGRDPVAFSLVGLEPLPEEQGVQCSDLSAWPGGAARMRYTVPRIQVFDPSGGLRREIRVDLPVEEVSDAERESALTVLQQSLAARGVPPEFMQQNLIVMEERWRVKCRFGPLRFDPTGNLAAFLEQNPDEFGSGSATLHVLSADGVYLAKVQFPTAWRDFALDNGVVYALTRNPDTDVIALAAYGLDLPSTVFADASRVLEQARQRLGEGR